MKVFDQTGSEKSGLAAPFLSGLYSNRPSPSLFPDGVRFLATDKGMEWASYAGAWVLVSARALESATAPTNPIDGQRWKYVADATAGVVWEFEYRAASASTYKWEFVGGGALFSMNEASASSSFNSGQYGSFTGEPSVTVPRAGDYEVAWGVGYGYNSNQGVTSVYASVNGANPVSGLPEGVRIAGTGNEGAGGRQARRTYAASDVITLRYYNGAGIASTVTVSGRYLSVRPERVS